MQISFTFDPLSDEDMARANRLITVLRSENKEFEKLVGAVEEKKAWSAGAIEWDPSVAKKEPVSKELKAARRDAQRAAAQLSAATSEDNVKRLMQLVGGAEATLNGLGPNQLEQFVDAATAGLKGLAPSNPSETQAIEEALDKAHETNDALEALLAEGGKGTHNPDIDDPAPPKTKKSRAKKAPTTVTDDDLEGL